MAGRPTRSRSWPLTAVIVGMPLWWALGLGGLIWQIAAIPMAAILLRKTPVRAPKGFGTYMLFIAWVFVSMTQADGLRFISVGYRLVLYIATAIVFLYVFNLSHKELPRERILKLAVIYTGFAVLGGYLAVTFGDFEFTSVTESLLPAAIRQNDYAVSLVHPTLAQNQSFLGFPLYRPTAPFTFTNEWGSALALLAPLMMAAFAGLDRKWRTWIVLIGFLALVPIVVSVNRGLWIGLLVGVTYGVFVLASKGDMRYLVGMLVAGAVIGLALVANALGFRTVIVIPETQSQEKKDMLRLCGAELIEVPAVPYANPNNYVKLSGRLAEQLARTEPNGAIWANQFDNVANRRAHIETTAPEIWEQTGGKLDGFVASVGSGGTLAGVSMGLKAFNPGIQVYLADPMGSALYSYYKTGTLKAEGSSITEGIGQGRVTANLEGATIDGAFQIADEEAVPLIFELLEHEGLCLGGSTGINVAGAIRLARQLGPGHTIATVL